VIIDIHTHVFPDQLAEKALAVLSNSGNIAPYTDGTCAGLSASMQKAGVDISVIMPIATKPSQVQSINRWAADINRQRKNLISFGTLHPQQNDWQEDIDFIVTNKIPGIKLHPDYQNFFVDDPALMPLYKALADAELMLMFHAGVDIGIPPPVHCTPKRLSRMLSAAPNLTVIAAHMGGYQCWDDAMHYLFGRNLYLDTSFTLAETGPERMAAMIQAHGADKILFGTDSPWTDQASEVRRIQELPLMQDDINAILGGNAARLLKNNIKPG
jgi:predicted TIM-barrel fold metal-dependent hydrolase